MRISIIRECPLCKSRFKKGLWNHFWSAHKDSGLSDEDFILLLNGLNDIPKCKICGELAKVNYNRYTFYDTCCSTECGVKIRLGNSSNPIGGF